MRLLPPEEWHRLAGTELEGLPLRPEIARVLVVEVDGAIVACWALVQLLHAEGIWIRPDRRGDTSIARALVAGMHDLAQSSGASAVLTASLHPAVSRLIRRYGGVPVPGEHFVLPMEASCPHQ